MKTIFKIAKAELALLFYSPIAWFLLVAFLFQCGLVYTSAIQDLLMIQEMGGRGLKGLRFLTSSTFSPPYGIWPGLAGKLYLYLPLLTMGLMSREINSGTIKLLYSSPLKVREIIFGKFIGMMFYNGVLIGVLSLISVFGFFNIHGADGGLLFSGMLGLYLLLCTYAAIGLFMSCLTSYQVVAALSTLVVLAILSYIGTLWQDIDFVRDLAYFLSINGRADNMLLGLVTTKDVLYFLIITGVFLGFSIYKLKSDRESKPVWVKAGRYVLILASALVLGYVTSLPGFIAYADATATRTNTLTANTQKILRQTGDAPIEVTSYINLLDNHFYYGRPEGRNEFLARWEPYLRFKPNIQFRYVYFYDSTADKNLYTYNPGMNLVALAEQRAKGMKINMDLFHTPAEMRRIIDLRPEENRYVMQLRYKGRTTFLRLYDDQYVFPSETETSAALNRLMQARLPKIAFVQGEMERSIDKAGDRHYKVLTNQINFRNSLVNQGFDVETVFIKDQEIPKDITALVIADPKVSFDTPTQKRIQRYIAEGGNLLIAGEPGKQAILNPLLQPLGVQLMEGMLVQQNKDFSAELIQALPSPAAKELSAQLQAAANDSLVVSMRGAAALAYSKEGPFTIIPLLVTPERSSWNKKIRPDADMIESAEGADVVETGDAKPNPAFRDIVYLPEQGDKNGPLPVVIGLSRTINGRQQRIVISGDADFLSNSELSRGNLATCNFDFSTAVFGWFTYGEFPIDTSRPKSHDNRIAMTDKTLRLVKIFLLGVLPGLLLMIGTILLVRRKRK